MWIPSLRSLLFGHTLPKDEGRKHLFLKKVVNNFDFERLYPSMEVDHVIRASHVIDVRSFRDALMEYGYLEEDLYVLNNFRRLK